MDKVTVNRVEPAGFPATTEYISGNINTYYLMAAEKGKYNHIMVIRFHCFLHRVIIFTK